MMNELFFKHHMEQQRERAAPLKGFGEKKELVQSPLTKNSKPGQA
jgi:hypothetical protein